MTMIRKLVNVGGIKKVIEKWIGELVNWWINKLIVFLTDSDDHKNGRDAEGQWETGLLAETLNVLAENRRQEGRDERAGVDGEVENGEELLELPILLGSRELVASESWHARFDTPRPEGDHRQTQQWKRTFSIKNKQINKHSQSQSQFISIQLQINWSTAFLVTFQQSTFIGYHSTHYNIIELISNSIVYG